MDTDPNPSRRRSMLPLWWLASLLFHALLLGWLIFLSPVRVIDPKAGKPAPASHAGSARAAQVMEQVRKRQAASLADEVRALDEARRELADLEIRKRDELRFASGSPTPSIETVAAAQESAAEAQKSAEAALGQASEKLLPSSGELTETAAATREAQKNVVRSQGEALESLAMAAPGFEPAYQAQARANAVQSQAAQAQAEAEGLIADAATLESGSNSKGTDLAEAREGLQSAESDLAAARSTAESLGRNLPELAGEEAAAAAELAAARAGKDKARLSAAKKRASETRRSAENARKNLDRAQRNIPRFESRIGEQKQRVARVSDVPDSNPEAVRNNAISKFREARRLQQEALTSQTLATKTFSDARNGVAAAPAPPPLGAGDLTEIYQSAVRTETELTGIYQRLRAAHLASQRGIPLARALELTDTARTARPDLSASLGGQPGNGSDPESERQAILDARSQIAAMRSLAESMLGQARGLGAGKGQNPDLEKLAAEDESQRAKDLTGAMSGGSGNPGSGSGSGGVSSGSHGNGPPGDGSGSGPPTVQKDLATVAGRIVGPNAVPGRWMYVDSWYLLGPFDNAGRRNIEKQFPPETVVDLNATYVGKRGRPVRWEFHQSARPQIVPPFDGFNPLPSGEATSTGSFKLRDLEYIIYYGYTEIRAVEDCEVWIAVGSDDFSKLWIEDQLVWASGAKLKSWRVDEGFRKIRLKQGVNRVLFRVENGHSRTEFSLAICGR